MRRRAVAALGRALGLDARPQLERALLEDSYANVREQAATSLGELRAEATVGALGRAAKSDAEPRVRLAAARALQRMGGPAAQRALERVDAATRGALRDAAPALGGGAPLAPSAHEN
jgi:HEAT repeat protein